jgi:hypothetical protein
MGRYRWMSTSALPVPVLSHHRILDLKAYLCSRSPLLQRNAGSIAAFSVFCNVHGHPSVPAPISYSPVSYAPN